MNEFLHSDLKGKNTLIFLVTGNIVFRHSLLTDVYD